MKRAILALLPFIASLLELLLLAVPLSYLAAALAVLLKEALPN